VKPTVVFLHGLARSHRSLSRLRRAVERAGYPTWGRSYPSRRLGLPELAAWLTQAIREDLGEREILGVTHSLGGIVVRHMGEGLRWRGIVMLAPPNGGSRVAAAFKDNPVFRWYFGPAGQQVHHAAGWPPPPAPFAVIAGTARLSPVAPPSWLTSALALFPPGEPGDGTLAVSETRLPGMAGFATVEASHAWIMNHPDVAALVLGFLELGRFPEPGSFTRLRARPSE
jgi:pimeloyl-ACP methyl ester carboxylesterase